MQYRRSGGLLAIILLFAGFLLPGSRSASLAAESKAAGLFNTTERSAEQDLENELLTLTNQHRIRQGLQELIPDDALAAIAREHSRGMAQQGFISHDLPSGDLATRMDRAGYSHEVARENVARAQTVTGAQYALINSPAHESNILANDVTRVGIGIVRFPPPLSKQLYITEIFASPRDVYPPAVVQKLLASRVDQLRQSGAGSMLPDPVLEKMASRSVLSLNVPLKREELQSLLAASANELQQNGDAELSRVEINVQLLHNPNNLKVPAQGREGQARMYGSAVRQVMDSHNQTAFLVLTLIGFTY
jgi:uncharacterized protein YkwD